MLMMCQRIGRPPISTMGLGVTSVSAASRVPAPPAILKKMAWNPRTEETAREFNEAWRNRK